MNFSKSVLIFVTLVIVSIVSAQEVDDNDLKLLETKFRKYYIQHHDSGYGGCDDGHEMAVKVKGKGSSYGGGDGIVKGKSGKGKSSGSGFISGDKKRSGSGSSEQSTSAKGYTASHGKAKEKGHGGGYSSEYNKGEKGGHEVVIKKVKVKKVKGGHRGYRISSKSDDGSSDEDGNSGRDGYARVRVKGKGKKGGKKRKTLSITGPGYSIGYDSGVGKVEISGSVKATDEIKGKGEYSSTSGSSGSGSDEMGTGRGERNNSGNKGIIKRSVPSGKGYRGDVKQNVGSLPVAASGKHNINTNSRREAPSSNGSARRGNQSINGKVNIRSVPVVASTWTRKGNITTSGTGPEKARSSNGRRHIGTVIGNKGNSTISNGSLILRNGISMSNEKGHNGNGRRSIGTVIGGRGNSSASSGRTVNSERSNATRSIGSVIGDNGNNSSNNGSKTQNSTGASNSGRGNGGNVKRNIGTVIGERNNKNNGGKTASVSGSVIKGKENTENAKRNVGFPTSGKISSSGQGTFQAPRAGGRVQNAPPTFTRSQPLTIAPVKPPPNVSFLQDIPYIDILFR